MKKLFGIVLCSTYLIAVLSEMYTEKNDNDCMSGYAECEFCTLSLGQR